MTRPDFDPMDAVEIFDVVNRQDWEVCELAQLGMTSLVCLSKTVLFLSLHRQSISTYNDKDVTAS